VSRINRVPFGLQELLGNAAQGDNPSELLDGVRADFDIEPLWHADRLQTAEATSSQSALSAGVQITVPSGEYWRPISMSGKMAIAVGDSTGIILSVTLLPQSDVIFFEDSGIITPLETTNIFATHSFATSVLYRPGTAFGMQLIQGNVPAPRVITLDVLFLRYLM